MKIILTDIPEVLLFEPQVFKDSRGFFVETFRKKTYEEAGVTGLFVQDNCSRSSQGTLRGLHAQWRKPQGKLIRVVEGEIWDVVVDIRPFSQTFKKWVGVELSAANFRQCWVPPGFAHGFYTVSPVAQVEYKVTDYYDPEGELRLLWNDPDIGIRWPNPDPVLSDRDRQGQTLKQILPTLAAFADKS